MLDLDADEQEIDLPDDHVLQVVPKGICVNPTDEKNHRTHLDLLYSNSICKQSSIPTSILIELLLSGGIRNE